MQRTWHLGRKGPDSWNHSTTLEQYILREHVLRMLETMFCGFVGVLVGVWGCFSICWMNKI